MSMLEELRARKKATRADKKKYISLGSEPSKPTEVPFEGFEGAIPQESKFFLQSDQAAGNAPVLDPEKKATPPADRNSGNSTNSNPIEPDQTPLEPPDPKDRLCYECQHFTRSSYGFPLGLCTSHGNRIQHSTSQPTQFGCGEFTFRQPSEDNKTCIECRHYNPLSTMCSAVNTGCPYPSIPPCNGEKFQHKLKAVKPNKEVTK